MLSDRIQLGDFELHAPIGSGGMGEVWRGVHRHHGGTVAVKVVRTSELQPRAFTLAFRNEVRQVAKLDHPHIVRLYDHGEVDVAASEASAGRLRAGSPYYVMEDASGGALVEHVRTPVAWSVVATTLRALLDGLAHAHARGVLHRDLTPRNVLISGPESDRPGLKLADFGLARGDRVTQGLPSGGTPLYMPPEQFEGLELQQGPWTDLYSLGCVAWELVTGSPLYAGRSTRELHRQHTSAPLPPLIPRIPIPEGLEAWLLRLLQKAPRDRFRFAADAARTLDQLGPAVDPPASELPLESTPFAISGWDPSGPLEGEEDGTPEPAPDVPVEVAPTWEAPFRVPAPRGTGLGLVGLRIPPLVGRGSEAQTLWSALHRAWQSRHPQIVVLRGPLGQGKTHLARSVAWRAHERLGAELWTADHSPFFDPTQGLQHALATALGCVGLSPDQGDAQIGRFLDHHGVDDDYAQVALSGLLYGTSPLPVEAQHALLLQVIGWLTTDRPLVLRLEDLQWGPDSQAFLAALGSADDLPVLVIATVDEPSDPALDLGSPQTTDLALLPLDEEAQHELLSCLLHLDPALARQVVQRTQGSPLFAEGLVSDWVHRQVLEGAPGGFVLQTGASQDLPDDLHRVWIRLVEALLRAQPTDSREALHVACALGIELDLADWRAVCAGLQLDDVQLEELADALFAAGLARSTGRAALRFTHPLVWESLRRDAVDVGSWTRVNEACAEALGAVPDAPRLHERLGQHLLAAGLHERSLAPLLAGARQCLDRGALARASALLDQRDEAITALGLPSHDPHRGEGALVRVRVLINQGAVPDAHALAADLAESARAHGWRDLLPEVLRLLGLALLKLGRLLESEAMLVLAQATAGSSTSPDAALTVARCAMLRGTVLRLRGSFDEAIEVLRDSHARLEVLGDLGSLADCAGEMAHAWLTLTDDLDRAEAAIREALEAYETLGNQVGATNCINTLGDVLRKRGDLDGAEWAYLRARTRLDRLGSDARVFPRLNLGLVWLARGRTAEADASFAEAQALIEASGRAGLRTIITVCRLPGMAHRGDWDAWDALLDGIGPLPPSADLASILERAAELARNVGQDHRAANARNLAVSVRIGSGTAPDGPG